MGLCFIFPILRHRDYDVLVWVMFALLAGGVLLGFLGLMIAVPVAAIIGVLIRHAIENYKKSSLYLDN